MQSVPTHKSQPIGGFRFVLLAAAVTVFLLVVVGNVVRVSGATQGCPDWPTCYGQWGLPASLTARIQYAHRALALAAGLLTLGAALWAGLRYRSQRWISFPLFGAVLLLGAEVAVGAQEALFKTPALVGSLHLGLGLAILGLVLASTVTGFYLAAGYSANRLSFRTRFARLGLAVLAATFIVMVSGIFVAGIGAGALCKSWPLCSGQLLPATPLQWVEIVHRLTTAAASILVVALLYTAWRAERTQRVILAAATASVFLFFSQVLVGAVKVARAYPVDLVGLHAATTAAVWAALIVLVVAIGLAKRTEEEERQEAREPIPLGERARDLLVLAKPIIVLLLLVTTYAGMVVGGRALPSLSLTLWTLLGGALAAGGSSAINQYIDRDLDRRMQRTAKRPLAAGRMTPAEGLAYGIALCIAAFYLMANFVNLLAALLSLAGMIYYVLLYSILLKRATVQNIVIGGGAGAIPPMVGWAAATGSLNVPALFLFAIVFLWTPPHFWALALVRRNDYARAGVPMLPVVRGERVTRTQIFIYTLELVGLTLLLPLFRMAGSLFLVSALVLGGALIYQAWRVLRKGGNKTAWMMYRYSSMYLALLFAALVLDVLVHF